MLDLDEIAALIARLNTPVRLAQRLAGWETERARRVAIDDEWSVADILAHLRAADAILSFRLYATLTADEPTLPNLDERRWARVAGYDQLEIQQSLAAYQLRRAELIGCLRAITPEDWERVCHHEAWGRQTLRSQVMTLVEHEEEHLARIEQLAITP